MKVKIKKLHEDAVIPSYAKHGDAGVDLYSVRLEKDKKTKRCSLHRIGNRNTRRSRWSFVPSLVNLENKLLFAKCRRSY